MIFIKNVDQTVLGIRPFIVRNLWIAESDAVLFYKTTIFMPRIYIQMLSKVFDNTIFMDILLINLMDKNTFFFAMIKLILNFFQKLSDQDGMPWWQLAFFKNIKA